MTVLKLGTDLDLLGAAPANGDAWRANALTREATTFGDAEAVTRVLASQLLDGQIVRNRSYGNKTAVFYVRITAATPLLRARGGSALALWADNPTTITWTPPDGTVATVTQVVRATISREFNLEREVKGKARVYRLEMECLPFGFSSAVVVEAAQVIAGGADAQINAAESTNGWTPGTGTASVALDNSTKFEGNNSLKVTPTSSTSTPAGGNMTRYGVTGQAVLATSLASPALRPYISFKAYVRNSTTVTARLWVNGVEATFTVDRATTNPDWREFTFRSDVTATITSIRIEQSLTGIFPTTADLSTPAGWAIRLDDLRWAGSPPATVSRESLRSIAVTGDRRTQGSLQIAHATLSLGKVLVYSHPSLATGYTPSLINYWVSGRGKNANASSLSGFSFYTGSGGATPVATFEVPLNRLPRGGYQVLAIGDPSPSFVRGIVVTVSTVIGGVQVGPTLTYRKAFSASGAYPDFLPSVGITAPTTDVPAGSGAVLRITFDVLDTNGNSGNTVIAIDDLFLLAMDDDASLTTLDCGGAVGGQAAAVGTANSRLWLDAATLENGGTPSIWTGTKADRTDAYHAGGIATRWDVPIFKPPRSLVFVANTGGLNPDVTLTHRPAWADEAVV